MTAELCYIGKTGTYRVSSVSNKLMSIATFVGKDAVGYSIAILFVKTAPYAFTAPYILSTRSDNTSFSKWVDNLKYTLVAGYNIDERLTFCVDSKVYYLVDMPTASVILHYMFRVKYSITVETRNVAPNTYVTYITTDSAIRVYLQYNNQPVQMKKTWYCRLKVYDTSGKNEKLVHTSDTVTVDSTATYCTIPGINTNTGSIGTGPDGALPIKLYLEYSFDKSDWRSKLLHTFTDSTGTAITCDDTTGIDAYTLEIIYE